MTKSNKNTTDPYKGVRDFYPTDWAKLQTLFTHIRKTLTLHGYEEYNASPLERAELYESKGNEEIINEQTYTFTDRGDRRVTLRPEMTPTLARMVVAKHRELQLPIRWFSIGNRFRYERPQRGRLREFYQVDVDMLGASSSEADVEIISLASTILTTLGAKKEDFVICISSRALLNVACSVAGLDTKQTREYLHLLDRKSKMPLSEFTTAINSITTTDPIVVIEHAEQTEVATEKDYITNILNSLARRGITNIKFNPEIVRGFDYYTGMIFEVYDTNMENTRALFGGGRYDNLTSLFDGDKIPAVGFGMGDVTLSDFLKTHDLLPESTSSPTLFLGNAPGTNSNEIETGPAHALRELGISTLVNFSNKSVSGQIREADKRNIPYIAIIGTDELTSGILRVKQLATGQEKDLALSDIASFCV